MNLMLAVMVLCVALGLFARQLGTREQLVIVVIATTMTGLYYFVQRTM
jgi:hypothetical protein